jgi:DNA invertase Pin-like site-specific DNA recombinase
VLALRGKNGRGQRDRVSANATVLKVQAAIYTRISKDREGAGLGIQRQQADCQELADRLGWSLVETFSDNDVSAYSGRNRPGYEALCAALEGGTVQAVIAWHTDRLHRRPIELESFIDLCERKHIEIRTVCAGELDLSTASGQMVARMLGAAARHEVQHSIERQKRAKEQAALNGKYRGGRRSFGYESDGLTMRQEEAAAIRKAAEAVLSGVSLRQVARDWNVAGLRTSFGGNEFNSREVRKILLRPRNAGHVLHEGKRVGTGKWETIVDVDTFAALEDLLRNPARAVHVSIERKYQGSGVYVCGKCGATMLGAAHNRTTSHGWRRTYTCSASKHLARDVEHLDAYIDKIVLGRLSAPDAAIVLGGPAAEDVGALRKKRKGLRGRLDELSDLFAAEDIDGQQFKRASAKLHEQLGDVEGRLAAARKSSALATLVLAGEDLRATWAASPPDVRGKVIDALMTVTVLPGARGRKAGGAYFDPVLVQIDWKG